MDDDWEDFLGLDDKPSNAVNNSSISADKERDDEEDAFALPEPISPLNPSTVTEEGTEIQAEVETSSENNPSSSTYNIDDGTFDMDFLSVEDTAPNQSTSNIDTAIVTSNSEVDFLSLDEVPTTASTSDDTHYRTESSSIGTVSPTIDKCIIPSEQQVQDVSPGTPNPDEFMSWLDDKKMSENKVKTEEPSTPNTKLMMDNFFDEVFGDDDSNPTSTKLITSSKTFESQLRKEISSSFCDVNKIRNLILGAGYLPRSVRGQVWSILTGGSCNEDQEAEFWRPSGNEHVENKSQLVVDCAAAIEKLKGTPYCPVDLEQTEIDLSDIMLLYLMRRKKAYQHHYSSLLSPLLVTPFPTTRALASSCFYAICSDFIPLINLPPYGYSQAVQKLNEWVRLLLSYHFPLLVLHLDRVFAGWEQGIEHKSTSEVLLSNLETKKNASLDEMERNLGLTENLDNEEGCNIDATHMQEQAGSGCVSSQLPKENRDRHDASDGCIPAAWLSGIFGDSLPPEQACSVLDWAILNEDKYFGVYFTVSLFGLYSTSLMTMNRAQIKSWITKVNDGISGDCTEWFKQIALDSNPSLCPSNLLETIEDGDATENVEMDWKIFMRGWLHATTALRHMTPASFKEAISNTELWAANLIKEDSSEAGMTAAALEKRRLGLDDSGESTDSKKAKMFKMKNAMEAKSRNVLKRLSKKVEAVRKSSPGFEIDNLDKWEDEGDQGREGLLQWPHASKKNYRCLWASAQEVIPSMCATQRKTHVSIGGMSGGDSKSFAGHFCFGCEWTEGSSAFGVERKGGEGMSFPQLRDEQHNMLSSPMYFTIDIRSESEMKLGKFPKAFCLDPQALSDPDMISNYLSTLEPVSEIAHLCVMGVGEEFFQVKVTSARGGGGGSGHSASLDTPSSSFSLLEEAISEYHATLMNVVMFFLKKGFKHVSILDGGFIAAVRHLLRDDCSSSLGTALVDVFPPALDRIFGEGTCARHLGISKKVDPTTDLFTGEDDTASPPLVSGIGASVNTALANFSSSTVGTNLGSFVSNLTAQVSTATSSTDQPDGVVGGAAGSTAEVGRRLSVFGSSALNSLRKTVSVASGAGAGAAPRAQTNPSTSGRGKHAEESGKKATSDTQQQAVKSTSGGGMQFVIDEDEEEDDDDDEEEKNGEAGDDSDSSRKRQGGKNDDTASTTDSSDDPPPPPPARLVDIIPDTNTVNVTRSEAEKSQALAMHILAGVQKGDEVKIEKASLPGAVLFPALKDKVEKDEDGLVILSTTGEPKTQSVHRFLVVTKERFIVLDSKGQGVGSVGHVKSNHHLTELIKITFKKKDPDGVILYISAPGKEPKPHSYKVAKRNDFIKTLQEKMKRFK